MPFIPVGLRRSTYPASTRLNIDPATLGRVGDRDPNGTHIYPKHVHKALRRYLGIENSLGGFGGSEYHQAMEMTLTRMKTEFESEWILIGAPETDEALNIRGGTVLHHSKDRDEVYRRAISLRPARVAVIFTGAIPEGTAVILRAGLVAAAVCVGAAVLEARER